MSSVRPRSRKQKSKRNVQTRDTGLSVQTKMSRPDLGGKGISAVTQRVRATERLSLAGAHAYAQQVEIGGVGLQGTRLSELFPLYEFWCVNSIKFHYRPQVAKTISGMIHVCPDYDPDDLAPAAGDAAADETISKVMSSYMGYKCGPVCEPLTVTMPNHRIAGEPLRPRLYTSALKGSRWSQYGSLFVFVNSSDLSAGDYAGDILIEYDITFACPQPAARGLSLSTSTIAKIEPLVTYTDAVDPDYLGFSTGTGGFQFQNSGGGYVNVSPDEVYTAILGNLTDFTVTNKTGDNVPLGTRLYMAGIKLLQDTSTQDFTLVEASSYVGKVATSIDFNSQSTCFMAGDSSTGIMTLTGVRAVSS